MHLVGKKGIPSRDQASEGSFLRGGIVTRNKSQNIILADESNNHETEGHKRKGRTPNNVAREREVEKNGLK